MGRQLALQGLYQWHITGYSAETIWQQFQEEEAEAEQPGAEYFRELLTGVIDSVKILDSTLSQYTSRRMALVDPVEASVLRLAAFELMQRPEVPYRVVINEALDLEHAFGAADAHKFVNGVLDRLAKQFRADEIAAQQTPDSSAE